MPMGASISEMSGGENITHHAAIRVRVTGVGNLKLAAYSYDDVRSKTLVPLVMQNATRIVPTRLVNFLEQRVSYELKTTEIDEHIRINRIVIFMKEIFTSYPGS